MTPLDWILSAIGLVGFIVFLAIVGIFVLELDLLIVIGIAISLAVYDFWIRPLRKRSRP